MKTIPKAVLLTSLLAMSAIPLAQANHQGSPNYASATDSFVVKAKVLNVTPIYKYVTINTPTENCYRTRATHANYNDGNRGGRMLLGGIIGTVIGNNIGHGKSRKATAVAGALIGSQIGGNIANKHDYSSQQTGYQQRCNTQNVSETQRRVDGYNVTYRYRGRVMSTQTATHPGRRIRLNVNVSPIVHRPRASH